MPLAARARAATDEIVQRHALPFAYAGHVCAHSGDDTSHLMPKRDREIRLARAGSVVRVGVADPRAMNVDDDLACTGEGIGQLGRLQRLGGFDEAERVHGRMVSRATTEPTWLAG